MTSQQRARQLASQNQSINEALVEQSRNDALNDAFKVPEILPKGVCETARSSIKRSRKERMRTVEHFLCDVCDKPILVPDEGFVIHGNIYIADPKINGGLIGNNFPEDEMFNKDQVTKTVMCRDCLMNALGLYKSPQTLPKELMSMVWNP